MPIVWITQDAYAKLLAIAGPDGDVAGAFHATLDAAHDRTLARNERAAVFDALGANDPAAEKTTRAELEKAAREEEAHESTASPLANVAKRWGSR